jgi:hypothetical protein
MKSLHAVTILWALCSIGIVVEGCSSDSSTPPSSVPTADAASSSSVTFTVPTSGGAVGVSVPSGATVSFAFPPSAAGKTLVLTPTDATSIGWAAGDFQDVIRMEPDGTQFVDPILVTASTGNVLVATFPTRAQQTAPEWLPLSADGKAAELRHFSTLAVVPLTCAFNAQSAAPACAQLPPNGGTELSVDCDLSKFCTHVSASCCVDPASSAKTCTLGANALKLSTASASGPAYCPIDGGTNDAATSDASVEAAADGSADGGVNGSCGTVMYSAGDGGSQSCTVSRSDGNATLSMVCTGGQAGYCSCYVNNAPYGQNFDFGNSPCAAPQLAMQQMMAYCGCP